eukprot:350866-Chlamydomonas_euryale.AAC.3
MKLAGHASAAVRMPKRPTRRRRLPLSLRMRAQPAGVPRGARWHTRSPAAKPPTRSRYGDARGSAKRAPRCLVGCVLTRQQRHRPASAGLRAAPAAPLPRRRPALASRETLQRGGGKGGRRALGGGGGGMRRTRGVSLVCVGLASAGAERRIGERDKGWWRDSRRRSRSARSQITREGCVSRLAVGSGAPVGRRAAARRREPASERARRPRGCGGCGAAVTGLAGAAQQPSAHAASPRPCAH